MDFKQLESFAAVVQHRSFTKAAQHCYLSQPTISAHIQALEKELNATLIRRTTKSIQLTAEGEKAYDYALKLLDLRSRMLQECGHTSKRILHLAASTIPASYILPELLPAYSAQAPDTFFVLHQYDSQAAIAAVLEGTCDLALTGLPTDREDLICQSFFRDRMVLITPVTEHFLRLSSLPETPLELLLREPMILREQSGQGKKWADTFFERLNIPQEQLSVAARVNDLEVIKNLVAGGLGISLLSYRAARNLLAEKRLLKFELPMPSRSRELYLICRRDQAADPQVREFAAFLQKFYSNAED